MMQTCAGARLAIVSGAIDHQQPMRPPSILIIEQGFLKPRGSKPVHGVEIFRLHLMRQLAERGVAVTVVAERSWERQFRERLAQLPIDFIYAPAIGGVPGAGLIGAIRAARTRRGREPFDLVMFGNARLGMVPAMHWAAWFDLGRRYLLFAHRDPGANFLDAVATLRFDVVANSEWVGAWYRRNVAGNVEIMYGLPNADRFHPRAGGRNDEQINFVLLGRLPNISKGHEKAIKAFSALPASVRSRSRLHLASFASPPDFGEPGVVAHPWMAPEAVPEFLRSMDVMLTISTHETFSQAIVQGMLTGLPIVASDLPVYLEKLDPTVGAADSGGGIITHNVREITDAMTRLAEDPALRAELGAHGRRVALDRYVWNTDRFIQRYLGGTAL